jgi:hypothetical protein
MAKTNQPTIAERLIRELAARGEAGMTYTDIQYFLWQISHPNEDFWEQDRVWDGEKYVDWTPECGKPKPGRRNRGFYCTVLYGRGTPLWGWAEKRGDRFYYNGRKLEAPWTVDVTAREEDRKAQQEHERRAQLLRDQASDKLWSEV